MPEASALAAFCAAAFVLLITPGPAVTFIVARSIEQGRKAGLVSALGVNAGIFIHVLAAVVGLSAIVASSAIAFAAVRYAGAGYLVFLGVRKLMKGNDHEIAARATKTRALRKLFVEALVVNVLNPKTALFFLAFLPQFVPADGGRHPETLLLLGVIFGVMALCTDGTYALVAGSAGDWLRKRHKVQHYLTASTYIGLGLTAAFAGAGTHQKT